MITTLTLLFYRGVDIRGKIIRKATDSQYAHVAIEIDGYVWESVFSGIHRLTGQAAGNRIDEAVCKVKLPIDNIFQYNQLQRFFFEEQRKDYSLISCLMTEIATLMGISLVIARGGTYTCFGFVAEALNRAGYLDLEEPRLQNGKTLVAALEKEKWI